MLTTILRRPRITRRSVFSTFCTHQWIPLIHRFLCITEFHMVGTDSINYLTVLQNWTQPVWAVQIVDTGWLRRWHHLNDFWFPKKICISDCWTDQALTEATSGLLNTLLCSPETYAAASPFLPLFFRKHLTAARPIAFNLSLKLGPF